MYHLSDLTNANCKSRLSNPSAGRGERRCFNPPPRSRCSAAPAAADPSCRRPTGTVLVRPSPASSAALPPSHYCPSQQRSFRRIAARGPRIRRSRNEPRRPQGQRRTTWTRKWTAAAAVVAGPCRTADPSVGTAGRRTIVPPLQLNK